MKNQWKPKVEELELLESIVYHDGVSYTRYRSAAVLCCHYSKVGTKLFTAERTDNQVLIKRIR